MREKSQIISGYSYTAKHLPTGEDWYIIGIDKNGDRVCVPGWPPIIGKLSDCVNLMVKTELTFNELFYRQIKFGTNWI